MRQRLLLAVTLILAAPIVLAADPETPIEHFDGSSLPANLTLRNAEAAAARLNDTGALEVRYGQAEWPSAFFSAPEGLWNWSRSTGLAVDVFNPQPEPIEVCMRIDNEGADGVKHCVSNKTVAAPGAATTLRVPFGPVSAGPFWGMRGVPVLGPAGRADRFDSARVVAFQVFLATPAKPHTLILDNIRLYGEAKPLEDLVAMPFVTRFGQYLHETWPGKVTDESELAQRLQSEEDELAQQPALPGRDSYGGWAEGPQLEATGWFRTQLVEDKWWLVTPEGRLFISAGMDCVGTWEQTFVEQRESWFEWLPAEDDPVFGSFFGRAEGVHSMAEPIGGKGRTFSFYKANLARKLGEEWPARWRDTTARRLRSWGFNTIGNWSQSDAIEHAQMPFVSSAGARGAFRRIEGGGGYWAKMPDVYDPDFEKAVEAGIAPAAKQFAANPLCIGLFADNEMAWEAIRVGTLASPPAQPCRIALVDMLKGKYQTLEALNAAWSTSAPDWDSLRVPETVNDACNEDLESFVYAFAHRYFTMVNSVIKREAPHLLYLGCRFASAPKPVVRACADVADVVSYNIYRRSIKPEEFAGEASLGKPILIGEFHFGALDRGMFHTGLVATDNQEERAASYTAYVKSVVDHPAFVGFHWFQYIDEPITGRTIDGENYNIGFVTVVDTPYPELVAAARSVHAEMYARRYRGPGN